MEPVQTPVRVPLTSLADVQAFIGAAQELKAVTLELRGRQNRESGIQRGLSLRIATLTGKCEELSKGNARIRDMWRQVRRELDEPPKEQGT